MKKIIAGLVLSLSVLSASQVFAAEQTDSLTDGLVDNGTFASRSVFLQAESLRVQRQILDNLKVLNEQIAQQNQLLKSDHATRTAYEQRNEAMVDSTMHTVETNLQQMVTAMTTIMVQQASDSDNDTMPKNTSAVNKDIEKEANK